MKAKSFAGGGWYFDFIHNLSSLGDFGFVLKSFISRINPGTVDYQFQFPYPAAVPEMNGFKLFDA
jgi:hypothetical protein